MNVIFQLAEADGAVRDDIEEDHISRRLPRQIGLDILRSGYKHLISLLNLFKYDNEVVDEEDQQQENTINNNNSGRRIRTFVRRNSELMFTTLYNDIVDVLEVQEIL
jgi:hypothetical protein